MQGPCEKVKQVKLWTILAWYLYFFAQNWKCGTSTKGTKVPPGHLPLPLSTTRLSERRAKTLTPMGSLQLEWRKGCQCLRILLAALCCQSACPPFQSQVHRLYLVWPFFFPVTTGIAWTRRVKLPAPSTDVEHA